MSKLVVYNEGKQEAEYVLDKERIRIGRKSHNDIQLRHNAVSGDHALIITIRNDSFLEDLHSTNGVRVNNRRVKKCVLQDGDEIRIAKYLLRYVYEPALHSSHGDDDFTLPMEPEEVNRGTRSAGAAPDADRESTRTQAMSGPTAGMEAVPSHGADDPAAVRPAGVHILSGPGAGKEMELSKTLTTLGKPGVQMAVITRRPRGYFLTHVDGNDFPMLNGLPIGPHSRALNDRDIIEVAGTKMEFYFD